MKICQFCGNRIAEDAQKCPICHRPVQEDFTIPKHPEHARMWKIFATVSAVLCLCMFVAAIVSVVNGGGLTTDTLSNGIGTLLLAGVTAMLIFFYKRQI